MSCLLGATMPRAVGPSVLQSDPIAVPMHGAGAGWETQGDGAVASWC